MHKNTGKVNCGHSVRSEGVGCDGVRTILETSSNDEEHGNKKSLKEDSGLKEESTEERVNKSE